MRILIVGDDGAAWGILRQALEGMGHDLVTARDEREAIGILRRGTIRLVIAEEGLALCRSIREGGFASYIYIILVTEGETGEGLAAGADEFLKKPIDVSELAGRLETASRILSLDARELTVFSLAKLAEARDPETGAHLQRVQTYSRLLADHLRREGPYQKQISMHFVRLIHTSAPLHDIGKVAIPDCVLLKTDRLSAPEFDIMKTHTTLGARTLAAAMREHPGARFLEMAATIAATHHERWDGTGYPRGLAGVQIPLCGRIVAVADVYDALTSKRIYKAAFSHEVARAIVVEGRGNHFDPAVVDAFLACERDFMSVRELHGDGGGKRVMEAA